MLRFALPRPSASAPTDRAGLAAALGSPYAKVTAPAVLFSLTLVALMAMLGPRTSASPELRLPLSTALAGAPDGWRDALKPLHGPLRLSQDMVRLTAQPEGLATAGAAGAHAAAQPSGGGALPPAPIAGLFAPGPSGPLPVIAPDGQTPFEAYSRPFISSGRPKVALVVGGLGLNARETQAAIDTLPPEITLSFTPYAENLQSWIDKARARGHEVLLEAPMEPVDYPDNDPGPYTLMAEASAPDTVKRVEWLLSRGSGYFALSNYLGSRFLSSETAYQAFAAGLRSRGLGFIDDGQAKRAVGGGLPRASAERIIDAKLSRSAIDQQLLALEASALQRGQALGHGFAYPVTVAVVAKWAQTVESRGYQLAPASALAQRAGAKGAAARPNLTKQASAAH